MIMTAEGNSISTISPTVLKDRRLLKRKRDVSSQIQQMCKVGNKVKLVYTATIPSSKFKRPRVAFEDSDVCLIMPNSSFTKPRQTDVTLPSWSNHIECSRNVNSNEEVLAENELTSSPDCLEHPDLLHENQTHIELHSSHPKNPPVESTNINNTQDENITLTDCKRTVLSSEGCLESNAEMKAVVTTTPKLNNTNVSLGGSRCVYPSIEEVDFMRTQDSTDESLKRSNNVNDSQPQNQISLEKQHSIELRAPPYSNAYNILNSECDNVMHADNRIESDIMLADNKEGKGRNQPLQKEQSNGDISSNLSVLYTDKNKIFNVNMAENNDTQAVSATSAFCQPATIKQSVQLSHTKQDNKNEQELSSGVKTITTGELSKFLNKYNLTLKAVPIDNRLVNSSESTGALKLSTMVVQKNGKTEFRVLPLGSASTEKTRFRAAIPINSEEIKSLNISQEPEMKSSSPGIDPSVCFQVRMRRPSIQKTTPQGTFCNWRVDGGRPSRTCKAQPKLGDRNSRNQTQTNANQSQTNAQNPLFVQNELTQHSLTNRIHSLNKNNGTKLSKASCIQHPVIPLSSAFHDLETRDKAARETVRSLASSKSCPPDLASKFSAATINLCPLSPTMQHLINTDSGDVVSYETDPILTSVVANDYTESENRVEEYDGELLTINSLLLRTVHKNFAKSTYSNCMLHNVACNYIDGHCRDSWGHMRTLSEECAAEMYALNDSPENDDISSPHCGFPAIESDDEKQCITPDLKLSCKTIRKKRNKLDISAEKLRSRSVIIVGPRDSDTELNETTSANFSKQDFDFDKKMECVNGDNILKMIKEQQRSLQSSRNLTTFCQNSSRCKNEKCTNCEQKSFRYSTKQECVIPCDAKKMKKAHDDTPESLTNNQDQTICDNWKIISPRNWTPEQVNSWIQTRLHEFSANATPVVDGLKTQKDKRRSLLGSVFKQFKNNNGEILCQLSLSDFEARCGEQKLANNLYEELHRVKDEFEDKEKSSNCEMYNRQHSVPSTIHVSPTSVEQLEQSVNFEDLLGSETILRSLEVTDAFDTQSSFLQSLSQNCDVQPHGQHVHLPIMTSIANTQPTNNHKHYTTMCNEVITQKNGSMEYFDSSLHRINSYIQSPPPALSCQTTVSEFGYFYHQDVSFGESHCGNQDLPIRIKCEASTDKSPVHFPHITNNRPVSPSTFLYHIPTENECIPATTDIAQGYHQLLKSESKENSRWETTKSLSVLNIGCSRETPMSDTDSGIHSPDSTRNKNLSGYRITTAPAVSMLRPEIISLSSSPNIEESMFHQCTDETSARAGINMQSPYRFSGDQQTIETSTAYDADTQKFGQTTEELWERCSTSSTTSTISAESETKLLNLDDCKTYSAEAVPHMRRSFQCQLRDKSLFGMSLPTVRTLTGNVVFVSSDTSSKSNAIDVTNVGQTISNQQIKKRSQDITCGQVTTVYPAFMSNVRRSYSAPYSEVTKDSCSEQVKRLDSVVTAVPVTATSDKATTSPVRQQNASHNRRKNVLLGCIEHKHRIDGNDTLCSEVLDTKIRRTPGKSVHLWEFIRDTLLNPNYCPRLIKWEDRASGIFRFVQSDIVAGMWGEKKNNSKMTYEKLSRAMRYYYNRGILERVDGRRLVYKFGKNAHGWQLQSSSEKERPKKQERCVKLDKKSTENKLQTVRKRFMGSKQSSCKIAVSMADEILPSPCKRLRPSTNEDTGDQSPSIGDQKSAGTQTPPGLNAEGEKANENLGFPAELGKSKSSLAVERVAECVIFVAGEDPCTEASQVEKVDTALEAEATIWSSDSSMTSSPTSPDRQSKLPSADVLLGKHYKIATVAIQS